MSKLYKKLKGYILTLFILICIIVYGSSLTLKGDANTDIGKLIFILLIGIAGISSIVWFRQAGILYAKIYKYWSYPLIKKWVTYKTFVRFNQIYFLIFGSVLTIFSLIVILALLFNYYF